MGHEIQNHQNYFSCSRFRKLSKFVESSWCLSLISVVSRPASIQSLDLRMISTGMISLISTFLMPSFSVNAPREISFRLTFFWHAFRTNLLERSILERRGLGRILDRLSTVERSRATNFTITLRMIGNLQSPGICSHFCFRWIWLQHHRRWGSDNEYLDITITGHLKAQAHNWTLRKLTTDTQGSEHVL